MIETITIVLLLVWVLILSVKLGRKNQEIKLIFRRLDVLRDTFNKGASRGNEHMRAFRQLADLLGYCVHEERTFFEKKLFVHKKEAPAPVRKLKVRSIGSKTRKVASKSKVATRRK